MTPAFLSKHSFSLNCLVFLRVNIPPKHFRLFLMRGFIINLWCSCHDRSPSPVLREIGLQANIHHSYDLAMFFSFCLYYVWRTSLPKNQSSILMWLIFSSQPSTFTVYFSQKIQSCHVSMYTCLVQSLGVERFGLICILLRLHALSFLPIHTWNPGQVRWFHPFFISFIMGHLKEMESTPRKVKPLPELQHTWTPVNLLFF